MAGDDLILRSVAAISALAPAMLLLGILSIRSPWRDCRRFIWTAYGLGFCVAIPTAGIVAIYAPMIAKIGDFRIYAASVAFIEAAIPEESAKYLITLYFIMRHADLRRPADALVMTICMALGFATIENLYYVIGSENWSSTAMIRAVTAVPMHATLAVIMGYYAARLALRRRRRRLLVAMWFWPFALHGLYDYPVFAIYRLLELHDTVSNSQVIEFQIIFCLAFLAAIAAALAAIQAISRQGDAMRPLDGREYVVHAPSRVGRTAGRLPPSDGPSSDLTEASSPLSSTRR